MASGIMRFILNLCFWGIKNQVMLGVSEMAHDLDA